MQKQSMAALSVLSVLVFLSLFAKSCSVGINYGRIADDLPPPPQVVQLLMSHGINRVKIFDTDSSVLNALANTDISVVVSLPNEFLASAANDPSFADSWVESHINRYYPETLIEAIAVGNEVFVDPNNTTSFLVPSMNNVYASLAKRNLASIHVSSPIALSSLQNSFPPSSGSFRSELIEPVVKPMLDFHRRTGSNLMVNAYPFFAYSANADKISLPYALFEQNAGVVDSGNGLRYDNLLDAQLDAVYAAMSALQYDDIKITVSETGWPSRGDTNEIGASKKNAMSYTNNLVRRVLRGQGTPSKLQVPLDVFVFALFNENLKPGPTSERNYGLFYPNKQKVYDFQLSSTAFDKSKHSTSKPLNDDDSVSNADDS